MEKEKIKNIVLAVSILLVIALLIGIIAQAVSYSKKAKEFEKPENEVAAMDMGSPVRDENGNEMYGDTVYAMPMVMAFSSARSLYSESPYSSVTINATVYPIMPDNQTVDWTVKFQNPSSTWARGKTATDYVTVTPASAHSTTATVSCSQPFGEKIEVVATSTVKPSVSNSCTVDFMKRVDHIEARCKGMDFDDQTYDFVIGNTDTFTFDRCDRFVITELAPIYTAYTVEDTFGDVTFTFSGTSEMMAAFNDMTEEDFGYTAENWPFPYSLEVCRLCISAETKTLTTANCTSSLTITPDTAKNIVIVDWCNVSNGGSGNSAMWGGNGYDHAKSDGGYIIPQPYLSSFEMPLFTTCVKQHMNIPCWRISMSVEGEHSSYSKTIECFASVAQMTPSISNVRLDNYYYTF